MNTVLIVSSSDKGLDLLTNLLKEQRDVQIKTAQNGNEARRLLIEEAFNIIIINTPLKDEFGQELALKVKTSDASGVILIVKQDLGDAIRHQVEDFGVFVVEKPISKVFFNQVFQLVYASYRYVLRLRNENVKLQKQIIKMRLINRAKYALMDYLNMSEEQAHRYIEKQSMDMQLTKKEIAENILKTYESSFNFEEREKIK